MTKIDNEQAESNKQLEGKAPIDEQPFGAMLKAAREEAGYSIERAAMATRIAQPFVEALEKGNLEQLPGAVFGRGFIRNLCKTYGKDSTEILAAFDSRMNAGKGKEVSLSVRNEIRHQQLKKGVGLIQPNEWKNRVKTLAPHHYLRVRPLMLLVGIVAAAAVAIQLLDPGEQEGRTPVAVQPAPMESAEMPDPTENRGTVVPAPSAQTAEAPAATTPASAPARAGAGPAAPAAQAVETAANLPAAASNPPAPAPTASAAPAASAAASADAEDKLEGATDVELRVKEPVVVKITRDSDKQLTGELKPDTYKYRFKNQLKFYVEDVSVVEIYFKGQRVPTSTVKGEPKRITFESGESQIAKKVSPAQL